MIGVLSDISIRVISATMLDEITVEARGGALEPLYELIEIDPPWLFDLLVAIAFVIAGWYVAKWLMRWLGRPVSRRFERPSITRTVLQSIRISVVFGSLLIAALVIGIQPGEILLSVTVFSAVLAVVLAPIVGRFISGLFVLTDRPFEIGDMIEIDDSSTRGFVEDVTLRYTKLFTLENTFIVVSNSTINERDIVNFSAEDRRTRQEIEVIVTYEGDLERARLLLEEAAVETDHVIDGGPAIRIGSALYPASPTTYLDMFGDDGIHITLRYWVEEPYRLPMVRSRILEKFWASIATENVEIAYPHRHLVFDDTDESPSGDHLGREH